MKGPRLWSILLVVVSVSAQPADVTYLEWIERTGINAGVIRQCLDCNSVKIILPSPFPFGDYYNNSVYVGTNGIVSFGLPFTEFEAYLFPHTNGSYIYDSYIVAPYWTDNDAQRNGRVTWEMYSTSDGLVQSTEIIRRIRNFIRINTNNREFNGNFVFVANWSEMHPYPAGESLYNEHFYLHMRNSYQAVLISDGIENSFAIFTFKCGTLNWSGRTTIGFNAGGEYYANHPLSLKLFANAVACLNNDSLWTNIIYDLTSPTQNNTGLQRVSELLFCSRESDCTEFYVETSVLTCCRTEGVYTYISGVSCLLCYEYGWVGEISEDRQSASPLAEVNATEGDTVRLNIYFLQNGPSNTDLYLFSIIADGTAINGVDYILTYGTPLELTNHPRSVHVSIVDNDNVYSGKRTFNLSLAQSNVSENNVTYDLGLVSDTVVINVEDNDRLTIDFDQTIMTVSEDVGDIVLSVTAVGQTSLPITVNVQFSGAALELEDFIWKGSHTLSFNSGKAQESISISIVNDRVIEGTESLIVSLTNPVPSDAAQSLGSTTIFIINDDFPHIGFQEAEYTTSEMEGSIEVCIAVPSGPVIDELSVILELLPNSSATVKEDFLIGERIPVISVPSGYTTGCVTIRILSSAVVERVEDIHIAISNTTLAEVVGNTITTVYIVDTGVVSLGFEEESYTVTEGGVLEMGIFKSLPCDFDIHFQVRADGIIDQELVLEPSENETMISVTLPDDDVALEPDENHMLILSLSVPDPQVELGTHISILTIADDDIQVTVGFKERSTTLPEDSGSIQISVGLEKEVAVPVSLEVVASNGSALEGQDFRLPTPLHFTLIKQESRSFSMRIEDDDETEVSETFVLSLLTANSTDTVLIHPDILNITITDNDGKKRSSMSINILLLIPLSTVPMIAILVAVVVTVSCFRRRRRRQTRTLKPPMLQCSNPISDGNQYSIPPKIREETVLEPSKVKKGGFGEMMGIAVPVLLPMEHKSQPKPNVSEPHSATETQCVEESSMTHEPNVPRPMTYRKPSVSAHRSDAGRKPSVSAHTIDAGQNPSVSTHTIDADRKPSDSAHTIGAGRNPSVSAHRSGTGRKPSDSAHTIDADRKPSDSVHTIGAGRNPSVSARRSDAGRKPSMSVQDHAVKPKCSPKPIANDLSSVGGPKPDKKPCVSRKPVTYRKPSVSSGESKPQCARKPSISIPNSPTEPKCERNDVRNYENIGICLLPKPGENEEPEVKPNAAYRCLPIPSSPQPSSEYAVPQRLQEQQRGRNAQRPSEKQAVEAYAISTL